MSYKGLKARLNAEPTIKQIWFDDNGDWSLCPSRLHPHERTRDDIFDIEEDEDEKDGGTTVEVEVDNSRAEALEGELEQMREENIELLVKISDLEKENVALKAASAKAAKKESKKEEPAA